MFHKCSLICELLVPLPTDSQNTYHKYSQFCKGVLDDVMVEAGVVVNEIEIRIAFEVLVGTLTNIGVREVRKEDVALGILERGELWRPLLLRGYSALYHQGGRKGNGVGSMGECQEPLWRGRSKSQSHEWSFTNSEVARRQQVFRILDRI